MNIHFKFCNVPSTFYKYATNLKRLRKTVLEVFKYLTKEIIEKSL